MSPSCKFTNTLDLVTDFSKPAKIPCPKTIIGPMLLILASNQEIVKRSSMIHLHQNDCCNLSENTQREFGRSLLGIWKLEHSNNSYRETLLATIITLMTALGSWWNLPLPLPLFHVSFECPWSLGANRWIHVQTTCTERILYYTWVILSLHLLNKTLLLSRIMKLAHVCVSRSHKTYDVFRRHMLEMLIFPGLKFKQNLDRFKNSWACYGTKSDLNSCSSVFTLSFIDILDGFSWYLMQEHGV